MTHVGSLAKGALATGVGAATGAALGVPGGYIFGREAAERGQRPHMPPAILFAAGASTLTGAVFHFGPGPATRAGVALMAGGAGMVLGAVRGGENGAAAVARQYGLRA